MLALKSRPPKGVLANLRPHVSRRIAHWRVARVTPLGELNSPARLAGTAIRIGTQLFLVVCMWRALYAGVNNSAGLDRGQAVTYAALAVLVTQTRGLNRIAARDVVLQHVVEGTILYWFLRPLSPRRYYLIRAVGDLAYGLLWAAGGFGVCLAVNAISAPPSGYAGAVFVISAGLGVAITYFLFLTIDLLCFWTLQNGAALQILFFVQGLLAGALAPLWFFPAWFRAISYCLPFRGTLDVPVSFYIGRFQPDEALRELAIQAVWCLALAVFTRFLWGRAVLKVSVQGG